MPTKETTYQRLKRENRELRNKLFILVDAPMSEEAFVIKADVALSADIEKAIWQGDIVYEGDILNDGDLLNEGKSK
jgi:hypothetical protein